MDSHAVLAKRRTKEADRKGLTCESGGGEHLGMRALASCQAMLQRYLLPQLSRNSLFAQPLFLHTLPVLRESGGLHSATPIPACSSHRLSSLIVPLPAHAPHDEPAPRHRC